MTLPRTLHNPFPLDVASSRLSPEILLLLACMGRSIQGQVSSWSIDYGGQGIDWDRFVSLADSHRLVPVLFPFGDTLVRQGMPLHLKESLRKQFLNNTQRSMALLAELLRVNKAFAEQQISVFPLKGPLLALQLYGDVSRRHAGDLDLLIDASQVDRSLLILGDLGYDITSFSDETLAAKHFSQVKMLWHHQEFWQAEKNICLELHWRLFRYFAPDDGLRYFEDPSSYLQIGSQPLPVMAPCRLLLYLCIHGTTHFWGRLFWLHDIAQLLRKHQELDWQHTIRIAEASGCLRSLLLGTALCQFLLNTPLPAMVQEQWEGDSSLAFLGQQVLHFLEHPATHSKTIARALRENMFWLRLIKGQTQFLSFLKSKIFPGDEMPAPLTMPVPVYVMLKPFRKLRYFLQKRDN
jgi:hypothetical protein